MPANGLVTITPSSIVSTGTGNSSSINTNGSVTFSSCATLSLNGIFTSAYENYMVSIKTKNTVSSSAALFMRLRASGTDNATTTSYASQTMKGDGTTISAARLTIDYGYIGLTSVTRRDGITAYFYGPQITQKTAWRSTVVCGDAGSVVYDIGGTHSQSTSYDGLTIYPASEAIGGLITVYGFNQ